jgi:hypothetical protein
MALIMYLTSGYLSYQKAIVDFNHLSVCIEHCGLNSSRSQVITVGHGLHVVVGFERIVL